MNQQYKNLLEAALRELPDRDRVIMRLHIAGETSDLIGRAIRMPDRTVRAQIRRITTMLAAKCSGSMGIENDH